MAQMLQADGGEDIANLSVEAWLRKQLSNLVQTAENTVDDSIDTLLLTHKQAREELRNWQHQRVAEQAVKNKAGRKVVWNVRLTIEGTGEGDEACVGRSFLLTPRQRNGGMCRIGRSTGADFLEPRGASLPFDCSISVWHGKLTAVYGQVFYSDLDTRNGSLHNGCVAWVAFFFPHSPHLRCCFGATCALSPTYLPLYALSHNSATRHSLSFFFYALQE